MFFFLYIPPYSFRNTPVHISYLAVYESRSLGRRVRSFTGLAWNGLNYWDGQLILTSIHFFFINVIGFQNSLEYCGGFFSRVGGGLDTCFTYIDHFRLGTNRWRPKNGEYVGLSSSAFYMHRMLFKSQRLSLENMSGMHFRYFQIWNWHPTVLFGEKGMRLY